MRYATTHETRTRKYRSIIVTPRLARAPPLAERNASAEAPFPARAHKLRVNAELLRAASRRLVFGWWWWLVWI